MGQLAADKSTGVQVQLSTSGLAAGSYCGYLCLTTNDAKRPKAAARIGSPSSLDLKRAPAPPVLRFNSRINATPASKGRRAFCG